MIEGGRMMDACFEREIKNRGNRESGQIAHAAFGKRVRYGRLAILCIKTLNERTCSVQIFF
jgi:hypothetical protein